MTPSRPKRPADEAARRLYSRRPHATAITTRDRMHVGRPGAELREIPGLNGHNGARLWSGLADPVDLGALAATTGLAPAVLQSAIDVLIEADAVTTTTIDHGPAPVRDRSDKASMPTRRTVLGVCGCAQAIFTPDAVRRLLSGFTGELDVVLSAAAQNLVSVRAVSTLGARVWTDTWQQSDDTTVPHIQLAEAAELVLVLPASASALFRFGHATCEDLLSLIVAATRAPVILVPTMNPAMWENPAVQRNVELCRQAGMMIVEVGPAKLACSEMSRASQGGAGINSFSPHLVSLLTQLLRLKQEAGPRLFESAAGEESVKEETG